MSFDLSDFARKLGVVEVDKLVKQCEQLQKLLFAYNQKVNLTRIVEPADFAVKHVADSLLLLQFFGMWRTRKMQILDIGCGAGFPALILAMAVPNWQLTALDSIAKKTAFVSLAATELHLDNVSVVTGRSRELDCRKENWGKYDMITARAVAESLTIYRDARHMVTSKGHFVLYKTPEQAQAELPVLQKAASNHHWQLTESAELPEQAGQRVFLYY